MRHALLFPFLAGCLSSVSGVDGGTDAGVEDVANDGEMDANEDVSSDSMRDVPPDAATCTLARPPERVATGGLDIDTSYFAFRGISLAPPTLPGYDLDGYCTTPATGEAECAPSDSEVVVDGPGGIDNSFAQHLLPIITSAAPGLESDMEARMDAGETLLLRMRDWNGALDDDDVKVSLLRVAGVGGRDGRTEPQWDGRDIWDIDEQSYDRAGEPLVRDNSAYIVGGRLVAKLPDNQPIALPWLAGTTIRLRLVETTLTGTISEDIQSIDQVWIQGRIPFASLRSMWDSANICEGTPLRTSLVDATEPASDVMARPRSGGPDAICEAVSFAIELSGEKSGGRGNPIAGPTSPSCP